MRSMGMRALGFVMALLGTPMAAPPVAMPDPSAFMPSRHSFAAIHYRTNGTYRSRGKQARPRKRSNRRHISRRVRRAHRRSKAA